MIAKFSVEKPFTIIVAVILVLVIGVVAFLNTGVDLLPEIELPYVVVMTTYPGASPDEVESGVTNPLESSLAALAGLESLSSISAENYSMIILQFSQAMNMDSAMIELSSYIDIAEAGFADGVAAPVVLRINPSMMPVMLMAADRDDMDETAFSEYVEDTLIPAFQRVEGVASVNAVGLVERQVDIVWDEAAIEDLNDRILQVVDSELAEQQAELDDAIREVQEGQQELEDESEKAYDELAGAAGELADGRLQLQLGKNALESAPEELEAAREELESTAEMLEGLLDMFAAQEQLEEGIAQVEEGLTQMEEAEEQILYYFGSYAMAERTLDELSDQLLAAQQDLDDAYAAYQHAAAAAAAAPDDPAAQQALAEAAAELERSMSIAALALQALSELAGSLPDMGDGDMPAFDPSQMEDPAAVSAALASAVDMLDEASAAISALQEGKAELEAVYDELLSQQDMLEMAMMQAGGMDEADVYDALDQVDEGLAEIERAQQELPQQEQDLLAAEEELNEGAAELEKGQMKLSTELSSAAVQLAMVEAQLDTAYDEFEKAREEAFREAGLDGVLTSSMLSGILSASNFSMPAGYLDEDGASMLVKVGEKFASLEELQELLLIDSGIEGIGAVYLRDVASVTLTDNSGEYYAKINGNPGIILSLSRQSMYSTAEVSDAINALMEQLQAEDTALHFTALSDQGYYIRMAVGAVMDNLLLGGVLAIAVLILFLRSFRPTLVIALSIPISLLFALGLMYFSGVSINVISLAGLAMGVGMLVDNSIVVIENIYRLRSLGVPPAAAAIKGAGQMAAAITSSTLTTVCVFLPIVFTQGLSRQLFSDMGLTVAYSLIASLLVALSLVPTLAANVLIRPLPQPSRFYQGLLSIYGRMIAFVIRHKWAILVPVVAVAIFAAANAFSRGMSFMPEVDYGQLLVTVTAAAESEEAAAPDAAVVLTAEDEAGEAELQRQADLLTERILQIEGIATVGAFEGDMMGLSGMDSGSGEEEYSLSLYVLCDPESGLTGRAATPQIEQAAEGLPIAVRVENSSFDLSALVASGIEVVLRGDDSDVLIALAREVAAAMAEVEGLTDIDDGLSDMADELRVIVDKNAALQYSLTVAQVYQELAAALTQETPAMTLSENGMEYEVVILEDPAAGMTREKLEDYTFTVETRDDTGEMVEEEIALTEIARIEEGQGFSAINHIDQARSHSVRAAVADAYNVGLVGQALELRLAEIDLPAGCSMTIAGESETINDTMADLYLMIALACLFIYLIMVAQFQSLVLPFIVILTIPLAFTGGLLALILSGSELSVVAMLGFLILAGVVVNNGIVFVDCVNQLRREGLERREALVQAGLTRLRPILMTVMTTVFAMLAMAFSDQMGAELLQPLALVAIGGLVYATLLTLLFVPVLYDLLQRRMPGRRQAVETEER